MNGHIIASSKPWHREAFDRIRQENAGPWAYVSTPDELGRAIESAAPRYAFFLHWNWLVPREIWSAHECVCFHMTDVPYGRGGSPLQNLIVAGLQETKLTALRMVEEMDAGPVYAKRPMSLEGRAEDIYLRAGELSWEMIRWMVETNPEPSPQTGEVTQFTRRKPEQSALPPEGSLERLYDHIRMLDAPTYPLAFIDHGDFRLEFSHADLRGDGLHANVRVSRTR
ncbi:MAG: methionyl-tRNA formyltransferase [Betaproteobacteria bacterium]|nr:methionyl-tRNA formyltransferase [Betaproteobacteria bacterium]